MKPDSPKDHQPTISHGVRCLYCGRFIGKNTHWVTGVQLNTFYHYDCQQHHIFVKNNPNEK